jgi:prevent-host-death family protein
LRTFTIPEAKKKFAEIVDHASQGERIALTKEGKVVAVIGPPEKEATDLREIFKEMEKIRKRAKKVPGVTVSSLIEEGRV